MKHGTRSAILLTIAGLVAYVTGLQKRVVDPVLGWFQDLDPGIQLAILTGLALVAVSVTLWRMRSRRNELAAVAAQVAAGR